jgi:hypothetical protein
VVTLTLLLRFQKIPEPWIVAAAGAWESCCTDPHRQARIPADLPLHQPRRRNASPARRAGPLHRRRQGRPAPAPSPLRKAARIDHQGACNEHGPGLRPDVQPRPHPADRRGHHGVRVRRSVLAAAARRMDRPVRGRLLSGMSVFLWRVSANMPQLNADGLPGFSANDWLAPVLTYVFLGAYAQLRPPADPRRYGQARALATIASLVVNVVTI